MSTVEIAAKDVKALRERTGAGMMDCKKALTEAEGDLEKAIEILRLKQGKKIQDLGERTATEGTRIYEQEAAEKPENVRERIVAGKLDSWFATIVLLEQEMHNPKFDGKTVQQLRDELTATTGENVVIRRFARFAIGQ
jgi:elongation factor Ts